jgi:ABC-2 type transport system permease protein
MAFAAGVRSVVQVVGVVAPVYMLGVSMTVNPLRILPALGVAVLVVAAIAGIATASYLLRRLVR